MSDDTAPKIPHEPVIWSHFSTRALCDIPRNVPDEVHQHVGTGVGQLDGVVMSTFFPDSCLRTRIVRTSRPVADYIDHIGSVTGRTQYVSASSSSHRTFPFARLLSSNNIGIGSDHDGIDRYPTGFGDVPTYPVLVVELYGRGWSADDLRGFTGDNFLRVFAGAEDVARNMARESVAPAQDLYEKRTDIPKNH
ncbi:hypothetical protein EDB92DRAFT_1481149 [Lactarius akahatsu]|uniref:Dipeptidase n=1 Tax=Lactarius akahatsu TaxID=416441 RepID=A0AAD4LAL2_9AGAM|nr:hypothetical protein EDB92DRAFT_1481149 [Lactarius akahatsu]